MHHASQLDRFVRDCGGDCDAGRFVPSGVLAASDAAGVLGRHWEDLADGGVLFGDGYFDGFLPGHGRGVKSVVDAFAAAQVSEELPRGLQVRVTLDPVASWFVVKGCVTPRAGARKIAVVTGADEAMAGVAAIAAENKAGYCRRHGYDFVQRGSRDFDRSRPGAWSKLRFILDALPYYDWVFWSDCDRIIMDAACPLEAFLAVSPVSTRASRNGMQAGRPRHNGMQARRPGGSRVQAGRPHHNRMQAGRPGASRMQAGRPRHNGMQAGRPHHNGMQAGRLHHNEAPGHLILPHDDLGVGVHHVNTGNFFIRNSPWAARFIEEAWRQTEFLHDRLWENRAVIHLLERSDCSGQVQIVTQRRFNSYPQNYRPGDFMLHFADKPNDERVRLMEAALGAVRT